MPILHSNELFMLLAINLVQESQEFAGVRNQRRGRTSRSHAQVQSATVYLSHNPPTAPTAYWRQRSSGRIIPATCYGLGRTTVVLLIAILFFGWWIRPLFGQGPKGWIHKMTHLSKGRMTTGPDWRVSRTVCTLCGDLGGDLGPDSRGEGHGDALSEGRRSCHR